MREELLIFYCAPTLAGIKTGSLFSCDLGGEEQLRAFARHWNHVLSPKGIRVLPLQQTEAKALIYVFRPTQLFRDLQNGIAWRLLHERGYDCQSPARCVAQLIARIRDSREFPHEIGLFLGYPPEDVRGFIEEGAHRCKCSGYWKVYGDVAAAQKRFSLYRKCSLLYLLLWAEGKTPEHLTAPV